MAEALPLGADDPSHVGRYRIRGRLGRGGQGTVYLAEEPDGQVMAVKVLHAHLSSDPGSRERFLRESRAALAVAPFSTARVLDVGLDGDRPYIVSELVDGASLRELVQRSGPLRPESVMRIAIGTAWALAAIHRARLVHRDFKPSNVLLALDGPRVIDFGVARFDDGLTSVTPGPIGTPAYMAPEQISGGQVGRPADLFSWALTMIFASTGTEPFGGNSDGGLAERIRTREPDLAACPPELVPLLRRCLAKDPAARPTADELVTALSMADRSAVTAADRARSAAWEPLSLDPLRTDDPGDSTSLDVSAPPEVPARSPHLRRRLLVPTAFATVLLVAVSAVLWSLYSSPDVSFDDVRTVSADELFVSTHLPGVRLMDLATGVSPVFDSVTVAAGYIPGAVAQPFLLVSDDDGATWSPAKITGGPPAGEIHLIVVGRRGWLALGRADGLDVGSQYFAGWTSQDGRNWTGVDRDGLAAFRPTDKVQDIIAGDAGFVAVGTEVDPAGRTHPLTWFSPDGRTWRRTGNPDPPMNEEFGSLAVHDSDVVAVSDTTMLSSDGGQTWRLGPETLPTGLVTGTREGFVHVEGNWSPKVHAKPYPVRCSKNGEHWTECGTVASEGNLQQLGSDGTGAIAFFNNYHQFEVWRRDSGRKWTLLREFRGQVHPVAVAVTELGTVIWDGYPSLPDSPLLVRESDDSTPAPDPFAHLKKRAHLVLNAALSGDGAVVVVGSGAYHGLILTKRDGRDWSADTKADFDLSDAGYGPAGWVASGESDIVTSKDGIVWRSVPSTESKKVFEELDPVSSVAAGRKGYLLGKGNLGLWHSADLKSFTKVSDLPVHDSTARLQDLLATDAGFYAIIGHPDSGDLEIWSSENGIHWTDQPSLSVDATGPVSVSGSTTLKGRPVLGGTVTRNGLAVPFTAVLNGRSWRIAWPKTPRLASLNSLAQVPGGLIATGTEGDSGADDCVFWSSPDAVHWTPSHPLICTGPGVQKILATTAQGSDLIALIRTATADNEHFTIWTAHPHHLQR